MKTTNGYSWLWINIERELKESIERNYCKYHILNRLLTYSNEIRGVYFPDGQKDFVVPSVQKDLVLLFFFCYFPKSQ